MEDSAEEKGRNSPSGGPAPTPSHPSPIPAPFPAISCVFHTSQGRLFQAHHLSPSVVHAEAGGPDPQNPSAPQNLGSGGGLVPGDRLGLVLGAVGAAFALTLGMETVFGREEASEGTRPALVSLCCPNSPRDALGVGPSWHRGTPEPWAGDGADLGVPAHHPGPSGSGMCLTGTAGKRRTNGEKKKRQNEAGKSIRRAGSGRSCRTRAEPQSRAGRGSAHHGHPPDLGQLPELSASRASKTEQGIRPEERPGRARPSPKRSDYHPKERRERSRPGHPMLTPCPPHAHLPGGFSIPRWRKER